jgi:isopenicillin N synthase-like dioxygenase
MESTTETPELSSILSVPIIDMSQPEDALGDAIHEACTKIGFFIIVNHGVSEELRKTMLNQARKLFTELSDEEKDAMSVKYSNSYRGYQKVGVNVTQGRLDGHEALDLVSESTRADRIMYFNGKPTDLTNYGKNQWPDPIRLPNFRSSTETYIDQMQNVGQRLMAGCSRGLGLNPSYFEPFFDDSYWTMRMIRYPSQLENKQEYDFGVGESNFKLMMLYN